ncbi:pectate lyase [Uliginosibacterium sp. H3]|uniref:Pectate lyase n=1 Tax=Uliginosibacterium silvisoli TaxID=3114758 RepID=A0ABU6K7P6_9RHOO|nr:pectate lyase [Uliginosibacterium sp. H3]
MTLKHLFFGLAALAVAGSASAANRPAGYVTICNEGKSCSVATATNVAFGRADKFFYKTLSGSFVCNEATFGGKVAGGTNECSVPAKSSSSSSSSIQQSSSSSNWSYDNCSNPGPLPSWCSSSSRTSSSSSSSGTASSASTGSSSSAATTSSSSSAASSIASGACVAGSVISNTTVDCGGITVGTSCAGGSESQQPIFTLNNATIKNVRLASGKAADGIHCASGNCRLENVVWEGVCEDAATNKSEGGTLTISGGSATEAPDKTFQHNSKNSTTVIENFQVYGKIGKLWRSCGDCTNNGGPRFVSINNVTINGTVSSTVVGVNRNYGDKATIRNLKVKGLTRPTATTTKPRICEEWKGIEKGSGSTEKYGEFFNTAYCDVSPSDVTSF